MQCDLYPQLCVSSLSSYPGPLKPKKSDLVNAAVTVSLVNARNVTVWATGLKTRKAGTMSKRESAAFKDCIQDFKDTFKFQMRNVETWMSAALTDEDSCLNGFQDLKTSGKITAMVTCLVHNQ